MLNRSLLSIRSLSSHLHLPCNARSQSVQMTDDKGRTVGSEERRTSGCAMHVLPELGTSNWTRQYQGGQIWRENEFVACHAGASGARHQRGHKNLLLHVWRPHSRQVAAACRKSPPGMGLHCVQQWQAAGGPCPAGELHPGRQRCVHAGSGDTSHPTLEQPQHLNTVPACILASVSGFPDPRWHHGVYMTG